MQNSLPICGLNKTTLLDYPGHVASTIFLGGCNFCCPFCHNGELVLSPKDFITYSEEDILTHLNKRKKVLSGVCITGGEPTLYPSLPDFISNIKEIGYLVKLDTNGSNPDLLSDLYTRNLLDYVAMDIKSDPAHYAQTVHIHPFASSEKLVSTINRSIQIIRESKIPYEFRTTAVKGLLNSDIFRAIGEWLHGDDNYFIQNYKESDYVINPVYSGFTNDELNEFAQICTPHFANVTIRGVD